MMLDPVTATRLEKAATDNGFELALEPEGDWLAFRGSQTPLRIWLTARGQASLCVAVSRADVLDALTGLGMASSIALPSGASGARHVEDIPSLHHFVRRTFQLARALPDEPLRTFERQTASLPRSTEAQRLVVQRVGQEVFRQGLLDFWEGRCAITGLAVPELLRASHIKPWADCESDAERLDVFNGLLLAPQLDAVFDRGFITLDDYGNVLVSSALDADARRLLRLDVPLRGLALAAGHHRFLPWHRKRVFQGN